MDIDTHPSSLVPSSDLIASFTLFAKFSKEVLVRLKQYKDDLLASCLFLVLSLPHEIVESEVMELVPALQVGQSSYWRSKIILSKTCQHFPHYLWVQFHRAA